MLFDMLRCVVLYEKALCTGQQVHLLPGNNVHYHHMCTQQIIYTYICQINKCRSCHQGYMFQIQIVGKKTFHSNSNALSISRCINVNAAVMMHAQHWSCSTVLAGVRGLECKSCPDKGQINERRSVSQCR